MKVDALSSSGGRRGTWWAYLVNGIDDSGGIRSPEFQGGVSNLFDVNECC